MTEIRNSDLRWIFSLALPFAWMTLGVSCTRLLAEPPDFNRDVRPILADKCFSCHGPDSKHREAELRLDVEDSTRAANIIVAGQPDESQMIQRLVTANPDERMPPLKTGKQLTEKEIQVLRRWIESGAEFAPHWAYVAPRRTPMPRDSGEDNLIDAFIAAELQKHGLQLAPEADRRTLIRRLNFDLLGLPPAPEDVDAFVNQKDPDSWQKSVEQLLNSEHYGERMAVFWLDLVRYADTVGYHGDQEHNSSPYRDYVIDAFNLNIPFDQFTREQLAGDLLPNSTEDQKIATCYNRLLQTSHEGGVQPKEYLTMYQADRIRNLSAVWMGATVGCAQCHDHKFDPYTAHDFYTLAAFFADIDEERHLRGDGGDTLPTRRQPEIPVHTRLERQQIQKLQEQIATLEGVTDDVTRQKLEPLKAQLAAAEKQKRAVMVTQALETPRTVRVLPRGNWLDESGPVVEPAVPAFLGKLDVPRRANRLDLANWLVDSERGIGKLTARVFVNRVWALFFGAGLCRTQEDFGGQGEAPDYPELLDALALDVIEHDWDVKHLVRTIVMSRTYRQSSAASPELMEKDSDNRLLARQSHWRLPAEAVRDTALAVSGLLNRQVGGPSVRPYQPAGYYRHLNFPKREYVSDTNDSQWRRGVYVHWQRQFLHPMMKAFDAPSREECTATRPRSNTPLAALVLLNDPTFIECAKALAISTLTNAQTGTSDSDRIRYAFRQVISRVPDEKESATLISLLQQDRDEFQKSPDSATKINQIGLLPKNSSVDPVELASWTSVCRAILNLSETYSRE